MILRRKILLSDASFEEKDRPARAPCAAARPKTRSTQIMRGFRGRDHVNDSTLQMDSLLTFAAAFPRGFSREDRAGLDR